MSTSLNLILKNFYSRPQSKVILDPTLIDQFLENSLGDYEIEISPLHYNEEKKEFEINLSRATINQLGALMYKYYLQRELDRVLKLTNIVGKDISLTGMGDAKRTMLTRLESVEKEISERFTKLKLNTYYSEE